MNPKISQALTTGLINGYGGKTQFTKINRGDFELSSSHFQSQEFVYHDEWTNNGGQESLLVMTLLPAFMAGVLSIRIFLNL